MYLYLNNEEVQVVYALLTERALWLCNKQIEYLETDGDDTQQYESAKYCARIVDGIISQIDDLREHSPYKNKHIN